MSKATEARNMFLSGYNCAQAVFSSYCEANGIDQGTACKIACGFGAGICRGANVCGAVTGAIMAISSSVDYGKTREEHLQGKERTYSLGQEFMKRFTARYGSVGCKELLKCDISTADGITRAKDEKLIETVCPDFVEGAVAIIEEMRNS